MLCPFMFPTAVRACMQAEVRKIIVTPFLDTPNSNFDFIQHPQILHCLKDSTKFRLAHACLRTLCASAACTHRIL